MKEFLQKAYTCILFVFLTLFLYLIKLDAANHLILFSVSLIIISHILGFLPFLLNKSKNINVRTCYLASMVTTSVFALYKGYYYFLIAIITKIDVVSSLDFTIFYTVISLINLILPNILLACSIIVSIIPLAFTIKELFKKYHGFSRLDLQAFLMSLNCIAYTVLATVSLHFCQFTYKITLVTNTINVIVGEEVTYEFSNESLFTTTFYISLVVYVVLYVIIQVISYYKYEKNNKPSE